jgi:hypothetical protein
MTSVSKIVGTKGADVYDSTGDPRLDLSVGMVRGADSTSLIEGIQKVLALGTQEAIEDAFVLAFMARDVRGGKGERTVSYALFATLWLDTGYMDSVVDLIPEYGSWHDIVALYSGASYAVQNVLLNLFKTQLLKDESAEKPSLCAKWAPREGKSDDKMARALAKLIFPEEIHSSSLRLYRKLVSGINRRLDTVEIKMSGGAWSTIKPQSVPGRAGKIYNRAFLNLTSTTKAGMKVELTHSEKNQLRHPDDPDRMVCREHFEAHFAAAVRGDKGVKVHGADTLQPHELVHKAQMTEGLTEPEKDQIRAVWRSMVEKVKSQGGLGRSIMMCDFSGSMQGSLHNNTGPDAPYWVSMALGLLGAECCTEEFKDRLMTFDSTPMWHQLPSTKADGSPSDLFDRLTSITGNIGQGLSTDFQKAMDLVLATLKEKRVRPGQEPENLIVLTDMAWDAACGSSEESYYTGNGYRHHVKHGGWETHVEMIRESFKRAGEDMWGEVDAGGLGGWAMPRIVIWNLAAPAGHLGTSHSQYGLNLAAPGSTGFHATADTPGVAMLSGWSATQFKVLCEVGPRPLTPMEILRVELDNPRYDPVRQRIAAAFACDIHAPDPETGERLCTRRGCPCEDSDWCSDSCGCPW